MNKVLFLLTALLAIGCQFTPDGTTFTKVAEPNLSSINLTSVPDGDTLFLASTTELSVSIQTGSGQQVIGNYVVLGDTLELSFPGKTINYTVNPANYPTGIYPIVIIFEITSGSSSLASKLNAETILVYRRWYFEVYNDPPPACPITEIKRDNGLLKISWTPYDKPHFGKYVLRTGFSLSFGGYALEREFNDISTTYFYDTSFVSEDRQYQLIAYDRFGRSTPSNIVSFNDPNAFRIRKLERKSADFAITWTKAAYYGAYKAYAVVVSPENNGPSAPVYFTESINDTTTTINRDLLEFGTTQYARVHLLDKRYQPGDPYEEYFYHSQPIPYGTKYQGHTILQYVPATQSLYTRFENKLFRLDAQTLDTLASSPIIASALAASPNGNYLIASNDFVQVILNPLTLEQIRLYLTSDLTENRETSGLMFYTLSNNNLFSFHSTNYRNYLFDMNTGRLIFYSTRTSTPGAISTDGSYYYDGDKIYRVVLPSTFQEIRDVPADNKVIFNPNFPDEALITPSFQVVSLPTGNTLRTFTSLYGPTTVLLDPTSNHLLVGGGTSWSIHRYEDGSTYLDLGTSSSYLPYYIFNGKLFRGGYLIPTDEW